MDAGETERTYEPVADPAERSRKVRRTVRVLLVNPAGQTLLFEDSDPGVPQARWWMTPGGGIDPGESEQQAAVREVAEETGAVIEESHLVGPLARRHVVHGYSDQVIEQDETFYLARVPFFDVNTSAHTPDEVLTIKGVRWWTMDELRGTDAWVWPAEVVDLVGLADEPGRWPLELGTVEESTVPDLP